MWFKGDHFESRLIPESHILTAKRHKPSDFCPHMLSRLADQRLCFPRHVIVPLHSIGTRFAGRVIPEICSYGAAFCWKHLNQDHQRFQRGVTPPIQRPDHSVTSILLYIY
ncbi:hypothetical protein CEXT_255171 [Caerostris extrusa]|uniref:Uncharacterized protein n=1 Tax=Caerostris extrusa TaxID=172846 RepID=A0AAV4UAM9_CAEEX|nr:hypothetical protein CEXT_255171 [Caerostris extrusa]